MLRSDDHGASFRSFPIPVAPEEYPYLAAVDATNPDRVYVRTDYWATDEIGVAMASDALFVTEDGGQTFRELYRAAGYAEVEPFNDEPYAHHWFEKRLS